MLQSVYQKVLKDEFKKLGRSLQFSHGNMEKVIALGIIDVEYGKNIFAGWINNMAKMPPKGLQQKVILSIQRNEKNETWKRDFGGRIFETIQFEKNGYMIERSGMVALKFNLSVQEGAIRFDQYQTIFFGIPAPKFLGIRTVAHSTEAENGWKVNVEVRSPLFGLMLRYHGQVKIEQ